MQRPANCSTSLTLVPRGIYAESEYPNFNLSYASLTLEAEAWLCGTHLQGASSCDNVPCPGRLDNRGNSNWPDVILSV